MSFIKHYGRCCYAKASSKPNNTHSVSINVDLSIFGTVSGGGEYLVGSPVTLVATPNEGYIFEGWYNGDTLVSTESEYTFIVNNSTNLTARFVVDIYNGHEYVDLGLPSGTKWATMNVGASSETDYGNYYQYGKGAAQYAETYGDSNYSGTEDPLDSSVDTASQVWGGSWHMPTSAQMQELIDNTTYLWVTNYKGSGIDGYTFTATNGAVLFIPTAGYWSNGSQYGVDDDGYCWSSSPAGRNSAYSLHFGNGYEDVSDYNSKDGYSVRPVIG